LQDPFGREHFGKCEFNGGEYFMEAEAPNAYIGDVQAEGIDSEYEAFGGSYHYINVSKNLDD
jgi:hypothetical protein